MKKINNRGFLLVETLVVATFCITVLVMLFLQFRTLIVNYNNSYKYNTVEGIYKLNTIKKYLNQNVNTDGLTLNSHKYMVIGSNNSCDSSFTNFCDDLVSNGNYKTLIFTNDDAGFLTAGNINSSDLSSGMKNFLKKLNPSDKNRLVAEFKDGTFASIYFSSKMIPMIQSWTSDSNTDFHSNTYRPKITSVDIVDLSNTTLTVPAINNSTCWDVGEVKNGSVKAWVVNDPSASGKYKLYIGGDGGVVGNYDSSYLFYNFNVLKSYNLSLLNTSQVTNMSYMFGFSQWNSNVGIDTIDFSHFDTSNVTDMNHMFANSTYLSTLNLSNFNTSKVTNMNGMFMYCYNLRNLDISNFNTSKVTDMSAMFIELPVTTLDLSHFDTSKVTDMNCMFCYCWSLANLNVSHFDTSKVTNTHHMFYGLSVTELDLSSFDMSNVTTVYSMFESCAGLKTIYVSDKFVFDPNKISTHAYLFLGCNSLVGGNGTSYASVGDETITYARIDKAGQPGYFTDIKDKPSS